MISLAGLSTGAFWALAALGLFFISLFYLLKLRRRRVIVPFLPLWQRVIQTHQYQSLFQRFKKLLSWLLQLLFWMLLLLALLDPRLKWNFLRHRHIVLILDTSASMQANDEMTGRSRFQVAQSRARQLIQRLDDSDRMMLIAMDREVLPLTPFTSDKKLLLQKLEHLTPSETSAQWHRALLLAKDALARRHQGQIILLSDGAISQKKMTLLPQLPTKKALSPPPSSKRKRSFPKASRRRRRRISRRRRRRRRRRISRRRRRRRGKKLKKRPIVLPNGVKKRLNLANYSMVDAEFRRLPSFSFWPVGKHSDNVAITAFSARRLPEQQLKFAVFLEIFNFSNSKAEGYVELFVDGEQIETVRLKLAGNRGWKRVFAPLSSQGSRLEAHLVIKRGKDYLKADNRAFAIIPRAKKPFILLVSNDNLYLNALLLSDPQVSYRQLSCQRYRKLEQQGIIRPNLWGKRRVDIVIFHSCAPERAPTRGRYIFFDPPEKGTPFVISRKKMLKNPLITDVKHKHPIMQFTIFRDVNIASSVRIGKRRGDIVLASSFGDPIIAARQTKKMRAIVVGFSLIRTDLPLRVAFPLFLRNAIQWLMRSRGALPPILRRVGHLWTIRLPDGVQSALLKAPDASKRRLFANDGLLFFTGKQAGFYHLQYKGGERWIAANFTNPAESNIRPHRLKGYTQLLSKVSDVAQKQPTWTIWGWHLSFPRHLWFYLLLLAIVWLFVEWLTYNRRLTV